jgi:hypothetical protein
LRFFIQGIAVAVVFGAGFFEVEPANAAAPVPTNAYVSGNKWHCNDGFVRSADQCVALSVPANAFISGNAWYCNEGFSRRGDLCVGPATPGSVTDTLQSLKCGDGDTRGGRKCVKSMAPANAYQSGDGWYCKEGYKRSNNECAVLNVPENAYVSGNAWYCDRGYVRRGDLCLDPDVPRNAIGSAYNWVCENGYKRSGDTCTALNIPPNAYVSGNKWLCKEGFERQGDACSSPNNQAAAPRMAPNDDDRHYWPTASGSSSNSEGSGPLMPANVSSKKLSPEQIFGWAGESVYVIYSAESAAAIRKKTGISQGAAVAISEKEALTNCHVVENRNLIFLRKGKLFSRATLKFAHKKTDRCMLKIAEGKLQSIGGIRDFSDLVVGETVYAIGSPRGLENTLSKGLISGLREFDGIDLIQTSAPISPGSSGGGLFDSYGNLIGITTFILKNSQSLNFAISAGEYWK